MGIIDKIRQNFKEKEKENKIKRERERELKNLFLDELHTARKENIKAAARREADRLMTQIKEAKKNFDLNKVGSKMAEMGSRMDAVSEHINNSMGVHKYRGERPAKKGERDDNIIVR